MKNAKTVLVLLYVMMANFGCQESEITNSGVEKTPLLADFAEGVESEVILQKGKTKVLAYKIANGEIVGYSVELEAVSRSGGFPVIVELNADGCVNSAKVVSYRAQRGRGVKLPRFTDQFRGKCSSDELIVGRDIDSVSGATLSAKAMTKEVKRAILLVKRLKD